MVFFMELPEGVFTNSHKKNDPGPDQKPESASSDDTRQEAQKKQKKEEKKKSQKKEQASDADGKREEKKKSKKKISLPYAGLSEKLKKAKEKTAEKKKSRKEKPKEKKESRAFQPQKKKLGTEFPNAENKEKTEKAEKDRNSVVSWLISIIICGIPAVGIIYLIVCAVKPVEKRRNWAIASIIVACIRIVIFVSVIAFILSRSEKDLYNFFYSLSGSL